MTPEEALGAERFDALRHVRDWVVAQRALIDSAETTVVTLSPLTGGKARALQQGVQLRGGEWRYVTSTDGAMFAIDEPSPLARRDPAGAVFYPELHSRLVAWWLVHAWRVTDLLDATSRDLQEWRISTAAISARALLEETGCFLYELRALDAAWSKVKSATSGMLPFERAIDVRAELAPVLFKAVFGSRMAGVSERRQATSVLTYIQKLAKAVDKPEVSSWYDWLSDAAHPAAGARIALSSQPVVHESGAVALQFLARRPVSPRRADELVGGTDFRIAHVSADAARLCGSLVSEVLEHGLWLVDDFGLTTSAATLTLRRYWRDLVPVKGSRQCPCGRGTAADCGHRWGGDVRALNLSLGL
ncbi:hypothetical protein [Cellulomonas sp. Root137]|uniref:hypothetical protein n=1 Tax=Cellulomonas sp. Root137 TaxID=1736459 RepID=UPI0006F6BCF2|nr:hypothetical protein [Cellulomonas sp. Root137]KQY41874.1 hypothetical protein ASD18_19760 [Cellulomonas sp. Root137]